MLTIFTPVYNRIDTLERLYESLLRQTSKEFQWIVVDDGSTDGGGELIKKFQKNSHFELIYKYVENGGKMRAINEGVALANGEFFLIVDSDDYITDDCVEKVLSYGKNLPNSMGGMIFRKMDIATKKITGKLYPKNIIVGIGCRRGTPKEEIEKSLDEVMRKHNLAYESIKKISTVDIKADEVGIIELAQILNRELIIISREDIKKVEDRFVGSEFVKKQIGVSCVSEPCALLASNGDGKFLEQKYIQSGITISIYEEKFGDE